MDSDHPDFMLGPELDALELREYQLHSAEDGSALIEFAVGTIEVGEIGWDSGPGIFRFQLSLTALSGLGRLLLQAAREFSAENDEIAAAKQPRPTATFEKKHLRNKP